MTGPQPLAAKPALDFIAGPGLESTADVLNTLEMTQAAGLRVRLPVFIQFDEHRLGIISAFVGATLEALNESLPLDLDDSMMGISLMTRLDSVCPKERQTCVVWLEGNWGCAGPKPQANQPDSGRYHFAVRDVIEDDILERWPDEGPDERLEARIYFQVATTPDTPDPWRS